MKYLVAVSGGVDSVVLLDILSKSDHQLVVAHVDHGIRGEESAADARFVKELARLYKLPFVATALGLPKTTSEERARDERYAFLFAEAKKLGATVVTAHHADDVIETIALNCERGTGWRGLAVLDREAIRRPLLGLTKKQLYSYALKHRLEWVEDATNHTPMYQRNRLRAKLASATIDTTSLLALRARQLLLKRAIASEIERIAMREAGSRHFITMVDDPVAIELVGAVMKRTTGKRPERPRLLGAVRAIRTANAGTKHQVGEGITLEFTTRNYRITVV
ncbi:MAG: tRNA lysidine(34) synthetase TilS [Candidatus Saccharimonas sp.]